MKFAKFNLSLFVLVTLICGLLTFIAFVAAAAIDEGTGGTGLLINTLASLFNILRFPSHTLFFEFMNGPMFFVGLLINCLFYGLLIERAISFYKSRFYADKDYVH
jgi:hypothetical protein